MENLCDDCYRSACMLHPDNKEAHGNIQFKMMACPNHLTDVLEIPDDFEDEIIFDKVPTGTLQEHLDVIKNMVEVALETKSDLREALADIVYAIVSDPDYEYATGELGQLLFKHKAVLEQNDISIG